MYVANIINVINTTRGLALFLVFLATLASYVLSLGHFWEARKWNLEGQARDRAIRLRIGYCFAAFAVLLSVALLLGIHDFQLW